MTLHHRRAAFTPSSFNETNHTVEATISTFADVTRAGFIERLNPDGLDATGLVGAPVLNGHRQDSATDVIGHITGHRTEGRSLIATIQLTKAADAAPIIERIREGSVRGVSIGYQVSRWIEFDRSRHQSPNSHSRRVVNSRGERCPDPRRRRFNL